MLKRQKLPAKQQIKQTSIHSASKLNLSLYMAHFHPLKKRVYSLQMSSKCFPSITSEVLTLQLLRSHLVILLTICHTVLVMLVWKIWYWINL